MKELVFHVTMRFAAPRPTNSFGEDELIKKIHACIETDVYAGYVDEDPTSGYTALSMQLFASEIDPVCCILQCFVDSSAVQVDVGASSWR